MLEALNDMFTSGEIWTIIVKVLVTAIMGGLAGLIGTLLGKIVSNHKDSKIHKYAAKLVEAAEQKFPNEGKKMGPEKMQYVMDQLILKFPKIADNQYLYNIAEAAVYKLNEEKRKEAIQKSLNETECKLNKDIKIKSTLPFKMVEKDNNSSTTISSSNTQSTPVENKKNNQNNNSKITKLKSF